MQNNGTNNATDIVRKTIGELSNNNSIVLAESKAEIMNLKSKINNLENEKHKLLNITVFAIRR